TKPTTAVIPLVAGASRSRVRQLSATKEGRSTRSSGGYPVIASSGRATRPAPAARASPMACSIFPRLPSRSPTVGLICASAIRRAAMGPAYPPTAGACSAFSLTRSWLVLWLDMAEKLALVTGGAGFIGSTIARALIAQGTPVRVFDNLIAGFREVVPPEAEFQLGDLRAAEAVGKPCEGVDVVYHQAALRSVAKSVDEPLVTEECNVLGTLNLLNAAEQAGVRRVVYAASSSAYGETTEGI